MIHNSEILNKADSHFNQGLLDKALKLYQIVAYESNNIKAWLNIGEIHLLQKRQLEALDAFREIQKIYPDSPEVKSKLQEFHDHISRQADELFNTSKFSQSAVVYERALRLKRSPETITKLISAYKRLNKHHLIPALYEEQQNLSKLKREEDKLVKKQEYIDQGKAYLRNQNFESAILSFENAFDINPDMDVFVYLAHIYKGLNQKRKLKELLARWKTIETKRTATQ